MVPQLIECVPNFSEGRDAGVIDAIARAITDVPGVALLDRHADPDHNRAVMTFAGPPQEVGAAAFGAVRAAVGLIDLNRHQGVHPRIGAADVVPFVPLRGVGMDAAVAVAEETAQRIWRELCVPVYLYEYAAHLPEHSRLEQVRREVRSNPERRPDLGGPQFHPTAGATVAGARKLLVAYNINLRTADIEIARRVARAVRASSGGLPGVKALGLYLPSRGMAQVSMNLTNYKLTPPQRAFEVVRVEAARWGAELAGAELIGLVPELALAAGSEWLDQVANRARNPILERRLAEAGL